MSAPFDPHATVLEGVNGVFAQRLADREQRRKVVAALMGWLANLARKRPVPDLDARMRQMQARVEHLVEHLKVEIEDDEIVVKPAGSDEQTWQMFRLGTSWFEPNLDLTETILQGLFNDE